MAEDVFGIVGSVIAGAYHVEAVVAEGGFGVVYRAHHGGFRAPVALKLLKVPPQSSEQQAAFLELFRAEAELLFRLSASLPTVVRPLHVDAFTSFDGAFVPYIVLEWLEGATLDELIRRRSRSGLPPLPLPELVRLLTPVARALERAHNFGGAGSNVSIVHRDLKPENIFVAQVAGEEVVKILDFGIGKVKSAASQVAGRASQDGQQAPTAFTPAYGAPEQWAPKRFGQTGPWTDVWGIALCLVEAMVARNVIDGDHTEMMGTTLDPLRRPTPRTEGVEVSDDVEAVFVRALAVDPRARQRDVGVFWDELLTAMGEPLFEAAPHSRRDARVEGGSSGLQLERIEMPGRSSANLPRVQQPSPIAEAVDLEFDPTSPAVRAAAVSGLRPAVVVQRDQVHIVPDLDLGPPSVPRRMSGTLQAVTPPSSGAQRSAPGARQSPPSSPSLDLEDSGLHAASFDLDLPAGDPIVRRSQSSQTLQAVRPPNSERRPSQPPRSLSGSMPRVASPPPSEPKPPAVPLLDFDSVPAEPVRPKRVSSPPPAVAAKAPATPVRPPPAASKAAVETGFVSRVDLSGVEEKPLSKRLRPAAALVVAAIIVAVIDPIYAASTGEILQIIGLRLSVIAGILLLVGIALGAREALREQ